MASPGFSEHDVDRVWEEFRSSVEGVGAATFQRIAKSQEELVGFALAASKSVHPSAPALLSTLTLVAIHGFQSGPAHRVRKVKPRKIERVFGESIDRVRASVPAGATSDDADLLLGLSSQPQLFRSLGEVLLSTLAESDFEDVAPEDRFYLLAILLCVVEVLDDACRN